MLVRILLLGFGLLALVSAITSAIIAAAPAIAVSVVVALVLGAMWLFDVGKERNDDP
jgi:putative flippase GtrA